MRKRGGRPWTIHWYVSREVILSFLVAFSFFFFIFLVNNLLLLIQKENILAKDIPIPEVLLIVVFKLPIVILLAFPFGTLVGTLMGVARLSADNEVLAMRAGGVSTASLFLPVLVLGGVLSLLSLYANDYLIPGGSLEEKRLGRRIFLAHPQLHLEAYSVRPVRDQNMLIMTGNVDEDYIYDVVIFDRTAQLDRRVIMARRARVLPSDAQPDIISLVLEEVFSQVIDAQEHDRFEYSQAESMEYNLRLKALTYDVSLGLMEKTAVDLMRMIAEKEGEQNSILAGHALQVKSQLHSLAEGIRLVSESDLVLAATLPQERSNLEALHTSYLTLRARIIRNAELDRYQLELHRKFAFPFSCLVFVIFTFPVGLLARRSGRLFGFGLGLLASGVYWLLLLFGFELGNQGYPAVIAMWLPNVIILAAGVTLNLMRLKR